MLEEKIHSAADRGKYEVHSKTMAFSSVHTERSQPLQTSGIIATCHCGPNQCHERMVLNLLKSNIPVTPRVMAQLRPQKSVLRELGKRKNSIKRRRALLMSQKGYGLWKGLHNLCQSLIR